MVAYDSEHICDRCKRRIKKGQEQWIGGKPFGPECAQLIRSREIGLPKSKPAVTITNIEFTSFKTAGDNYELEVYDE